ncbi:MAG: NAD(P)/FAD-dependent oxidoreductase [Pseudomonadota bacterium]
MTRYVVLGAGAMGLAAAHRLLADGAGAVTVLEADSVPGGMAAHFNLGGMSIERFYHFVCKADQPTFDLMEELGIADRLVWRATRMGTYSSGKIHPWGNPVALLTYPDMGLIEKLRYGMMAFFATKRRSWKDLDGLSAREWLESWLGRSGYARSWEPLMRLKFFEHADRISAAWVWSRIKRVGTSRRSLMVEELGYIDGGSETLVDALVGSIEGRGGQIRLGDPAAEVIAGDGHTTAVRTRSGEVIPADAVISTIPVQRVPDLVPALPEDWKARYREIENIPVVCIAMQLKRKVSENFWVNIAHPDFEIPGFIEFSNLRDLPNPVVYVPYYMPATHPKWNWSDAQFVDEAFGYLRRINPALIEDDLVASHIGRLRHAQPVCDVGFSKSIPPLQTPIRGLQVADTCFYYPEDRGIAESVRLGAEMARTAQARSRQSVVA